VEFASNDERMSYLKLAATKRREAGAEDDVVVPAEGDEPTQDVALSAERVAELEAAEEILLTVTDGGFGKRSSAYEYRVTGRGGQGIANITLSRRTGTAVAATFPVRPGDDVMLITDAGRLIRVPADQVRITGRQAQGVTLFRLDANEKVTSVFPILEDAASDDDGGSDNDTETAGDG
jgi:DNA gyrase subunit A